MSKANSEKLPPKPRPHSFDIGVHQHQGKDTKEFTPPKGIGVYKSGSGTFMFSSTSMSAALDNLQYYPKVSQKCCTCQVQPQETHVPMFAAMRFVWLYQLYHCYALTLGAPELQAAAVHLSAFLSAWACSTTKLACKNILSAHINQHVQPGLLGSP